MAWTLYASGMIDLLSSKKPLLQFIVHDVRKLPLKVSDIYRRLTL